MDKHLARFESSFCRLRVGIRTGLGVGVLAVAFAGCLFGTGDAERRVREATGVGETDLFSFQYAAGPAVDWLSDEVVVFATSTGAAMVDVVTGRVTERVDPSITPPNAAGPPVDRTSLTPGAIYGPWVVKNSGFSLKADDSGDVTCDTLLVSPDGRYAACNYHVTDRMAESTDGAPAVVRLR